MSDPTLVKGFDGIAPKVGGKGYILFCLWRLNSKLYIQITGNSEGGRFNDKYLYSLRTLLELENGNNYVKAYSLQDRKEVEDRNANIKSFLKAIKNNII